MAMLIVCLVGPLAATPAIIYFSRHLFAIFVREGASLFVGMDMHKDWAFTLATPIAIANAIIFTLAWWAAIGLSTLDPPVYSLVAPFLIALALAMLVTSVFVKDRLQLHTSDACMVGLLAFAGGNLPVIIAMPVLLMAVLNV